MTQWKLWLLLFLMSMLLKATCASVFPHLASSNKKGFTGIHKLNVMLKNNGRNQRTLQDSSSSSSSSTLRRSGPVSLSPFFAPLLSKLVLLRQQPPSMIKFCVGATCGLGYYLLQPSPVQAKDNFDKSIKVPRHKVIRRSAIFWKNVAPIIIHYKFAKMWMNRVKSYDKEERDVVYERLHEMYAPEARNVICELRGLFVKIGQVISSRPDFVPSLYIEHFQELQDSVPPYPSDQIKSVISHSLQQNFGMKFDDVFEEFSDEPLGSASIGQVHEAKLTSNFEKKCYGYIGGPKVAVKVMHLDAEDLFRNDFKTFKWLCRFALPGWTPILTELERQIMTEFDYRNEASSLNKVRENMMSSPYKNLVRVPQPVECYSTRNVLIMEKFKGNPLIAVAENNLTEILKGDRQLAKTMMEKRRQAIFCDDTSKETEQETIKLLQEAISHHSLFTRASILWRMKSLISTQRKYTELLLDVHGYQIFVNGVFNGDPHPGNILVLQNGQLGLIDYGQCYKLRNDDRLALAKIVKEVGSIEIDDEKVSSYMREMGFIFRNYKDNVMKETAILFFDSDEKRRELGFPSPQELLMYLNELDPLEYVPDAAGNYKLYTHLPKILGNSFISSLTSIFN